MPSNKTIKLIWGRDLQRRQTTPLSVLIYDPILSLLISLQIQNCNAHNDTFDATEKLIARPEDKPHSEDMHNFS